MKILSDLFFLFSLCEEARALRLKEANLVEELGGQEIAFSSEFFEVILKTCTLKVYLAQLLFFIVLKEGF